MQAGLFTLHGVNLAPVDKLVDLGRRLSEYRAEITARAFTVSKNGYDRSAQVTVEEPSTMSEANKALLRADAS